VVIPVKATNVLALPIKPRIGTIKKMHVHLGRLDA